MKETNLTINITVQNMPEDNASDCKYLLVTYDNSKNEWWYYGGDNDINKCEELARKKNVIVFLNPFYEGGRQSNDNGR